MNRQVILKAKSTKILDKVLEVEIPDIVYDEAIKICEK